MFDAWVCEFVWEDTEFPFFLGLRLIFNFGCMVFDGIWVTTKFHFFIWFLLNFQFWTCVLVKVPGRGV